ncbi:MAG: ribosome biogenesis GTPase Der [bacterium]
MKKLSKKPLVAIIGRPNVGKSTLFNRLVGRKKAIVHETSGITRDRIEGIVEWNEREFLLADLAGWEEKLDSPFEDEVKEIIDETIERAELLLFMVDGRSGLIPQDKILAKKVRRLGKITILLVNKIDHSDMEKYQGEFLGLGFDKTLMISAAHSRSINDVLDEIIEMLEFPDDDSDDESGNTIGLALIGRQNVGKSSLFNFLLGNKRSIVSPIPGTTRDSVDAWFKYENQKYAIVDTAGLKKQSRTTEDVDYYSAVRARRSLDRADIALFMLDAQDGVLDTDLKIADTIEKSRRGVVMLANKWDLAKKDTPQNRTEFEKHIRKKVHFFSHVPIVFTSGLKGIGIEDLIKAINLVHLNFNLRIQTSELNRIITDAYEHRPPQSYRGRAPKVFYTHQVSAAPPTFQFFVNDPKLFHSNYRKYLEKQVRRVFGFDGAPLLIFYKQRKKTKSTLQA